MYCWQHVNDHLIGVCRFGPWFALRAVVIFDDLEYKVERPLDLASPLTADSREKVMKGMEAAIKASKIPAQSNVVDYELLFPCHAVETSVIFAKHILMVSRS